MELKNIEFYNTPDGDVVAKDMVSNTMVMLKESKELVAKMLDLISSRFPKAFAALMGLYKPVYRDKEELMFRIVDRFVRCNFGSYDQLRIDIDASGCTNLEEVPCPLRGECPYCRVICLPTLSTSLSTREYEISRLMVEERMTKQQTADRLFISIATVTNHLANIRAKLGVHSMEELTHWWFKQKENGL